MKDAKHVALFVVIGLALAWTVSGPLRNPPERAPRVGTPLRGEPRPATPGKLYADGVVRLSDGVTPAPGQPLFIIARPAAGGPPVAVRKILNPQFPLEFSLSTADNMVGEEFFDGNLSIVARLDADGSAGPRQPSDREGSASAGSFRRTVRITIQP